MNDGKFDVNDGDAWYNRNKNALKIENDKIMQALDGRVDTKIHKSILEIGCANGYRLNEINKKYGIYCMGTDISKIAIEEGRKTYKNIAFIQTDISKEFIANQKYDIIIINFVLHWIERNKLCFTIGNIDYMINNGGLLIIGDFGRDGFYQTDFKHREGIKTFTAPYDKMFEMTGEYKILETIKYDTENENKTKKVTVLKKETQYKEVII